MPKSAAWRCGAFVLFWAALLAASVFGISRSEAREVLLPHNLPLSDALASEEHRYDLAKEHLDENQRAIELEHKQRLEDIARDDRIDGDEKARRRAEADDNYQRMMRANDRQRAVEEEYHAQNEAAFRAQYTGPLTESISDGPPNADPIARNEALASEQSQYELETAHNEENKRSVEAAHEDRLQAIDADSTLPADVKQMERENENGRSAVEMRALDRQRKVIDEAHENRLALIDAQFGGAGTDVFSAAGDDPASSTEGNTAEAGPIGQLPTGYSGAIGHTAIGGADQPAGNAEETTAGAPPSGNTGSSGQALQGADAQSNAGKQDAAAPESPEDAPVQTGPTSFALHAESGPTSADGSGAGESGEAAKYADGFTKGVATCLEGVVTLPLQAAKTILATTARFGAHAGYYWEIGAALSRGDTAGAQRILDLKTEEDVQNYDLYVKSLPKLVHLDPAEAGPTAQESGARQGFLLCQHVLLPALMSAKSKPAKSQSGEAELGGGTAPGAPDPNAPHYQDDTKMSRNPSALPPQGPLPNCGALSCARVAEVLGKGLEGGLTRVLDKIKPKVRIDATKSLRQPELAGGLTADAIKDGLGSIGIPAAVGKGIGDLTDRLKEGRPVIAGVAESLPGTPGTPLPPGTPLHAVVVEGLEVRNGTAGVITWDPRGFYAWQPLATFERFFTAAGSEFVWPL